MAVARVFATAELVEKILLQLPTKDLLLSKRVCKTFENVHNQFPSIKKALFLVPGTVVSEMVALSQHMRLERTVFRTLLILTFQASDTAADARYPSPHQPASISALRKMWLRAGYQIQLPEAALCGGIAFNPLLVQKICGLQLVVAKERYQDIWRGPINLHPDLLFTPGISSCNGMFFSQPPLQVMTTTVYADDRHPSDESFTGAEKLSELATEWQNVFAKKGQFKWPIRGWAAGLKGQWHRTS